MEYLLAHLKGSNFFLILVSALSMFRSIFHVAHIQCWKVYIEFYLSQTRTLYTHRMFKIGQTHTHTQSKSIKRQRKPRLWGGNGCAKGTGDCYHANPTRLKYTVNFIVQFRYIHLSIFNSMLAKLNQVFTKSEWKPCLNSLIQIISLFHTHTARHRPVQVTLPKLPRKRNLKYGSSSNLKQTFSREMKHSWNRLKAMAIATNNNARLHAHALQYSL